MNDSSFLARLARALDNGSPLEALEARLTSSDLQSLLLHVFARRSARRTAAELLTQYERAAMLRPSGVDARALAELERSALTVSKNFAAVELAPIAPLGLNTVLGQIHQNNCLATVRHSEVLADPTTVAALESARRRRAGEQGEIRLCSRARLLRLQPFDAPEFSPHFSLFWWATAGRDRGDHRFELDSLREHICCHLDVLQSLPAAGYELGGIIVEVSHTERDERRLQQVSEHVFPPLQLRFPAVSFAFDREREHARHYYSGLCLHIDVMTPAGRRYNLSDGGLATWTQRLLSNRKERFMVSALGLELIPKVFERRSNFRSP